MAEDFGKTLLIVNPAAQSGKGAIAGSQAETLIRDRIGDALDVKLTEAPRHAIEIAAAAAEYDTVIALGGDGVIHEVANGLMQIDKAERPAMGIIPVGSGNDYSRSLVISKDIPTAVSQLFDAERKPVDIGCCNGEYFVETLSFGLDAGIALDTVERRKTTNKTDTALYFESGIDQLLHHLDTYHVTATLDGERVLEDDVMMFAVQVGVTYGGGFRVCPDAKLDDGLFDICYCHAPIGLPKAVFIFAMAKDGRHTKYKPIHFDQAATLEIDFDHRPPCQVDGEAHIADHYSVRILKQEITVLFNG